MSPAASPMPIHPSLNPGLEAYERGDFVAALIAWEEPWQRQDGDEKALCLALVRLAGALHHHRAGRETSARRLREAALSTLEPLPSSVLGVDVAALVEGIRANLEPPPEIEPARQIPLGSKIRFAAFLAILVGAGLLFRYTPLSRFLDEGEVVALLDHLAHAWWAPLAHIGAFLVLAPSGVPISPLLLAGGIVFGLGRGALYNGVGAILGAAVSYALARGLGHDLVQRLIGERLRPVQRFLARHGFWSLVGVRFMPIPFAAVNYGLALAGVSGSRFLATTSLGLLPSAFVYTYLATALWEVAKEGDPRAALEVLLAVLLVGALGFAPTVWRLWERRRRYQRLVEERERKKEERRKKKEKRLGERNFEG